MARFEAQKLALDAVAALGPLVGTVAQHDRDLASQLRRAGSSLPLNVAEGARREGRDRLQHYRIAAGSAAEARSALQVARAWGYIGGAEVEQADELLDRCLAVLWRLTHPTT